MLDTTTKQKIDSLRNLLVGKVPDPKSQVEQITVALFYKFMWDRDKEIKDLGGNATFFVGKFKKYSWENLFSPDLGGSEFIKLYSEAIEEMEKNPNIPSVFRDIFKRAFLPYKDPFTLRLFLKEINDFHYSNSEKLGDGFEYLLSILGTQGDAGQFRTPRHIIDFITEIVNPKKNETVLDPACGTAGFLISAYKHILKQNTKKNLGDGLNASDRKKIGENLNGYDISPDMVKMSLVNMYLHKFTNPEINEYDTLSSEDRWNEYYDVILANPPFFSPKGGITPHNRFGVKSTKAEVLFIDYINEHLKPNGRAGIIVPEGVIFQAGTAYKQLRKKLIESSLIGVVSLPAGVFNHYSGVKTSILILDKAKNKIENNIFFIDLKNDGYSLGANRNKVEGSEINEKIKLIKDYYNNKKNLDLQNISKKDILNTDDVIFNFHNFTKEKNSENKDLIKLDEVVDISNGFAFESKNYSNNGYRIIRITNVQKGQIIDDNPKFHPELKKDSEHKKFNIEENEILVSLTGNVGRVGMANKDLLPAYLNQRVAKIKLKDDSKNNIKYFFHILNSEYFEKEAIVNSFGVAQKNLSTKWISNFQIPLPSIETQNKIVEELDDYRKIVDGCRQVVENYSPTFNIDPSWKTVELGDLCKKITDGSHFSPETLSDGLPYITVKDLKKSKIDLLNCKKISKKNYDLLVKNGCKPNKDDTLFSKDGTVGKTAFVNEDDNFVILSSLAILTPDKSKIEPKFLFLLLSSKFFINEAINQKTGVAIRRIVLKTLKKIKVPLPPKNIQIEIIETLEKEMQIVENSENLISIFKKKIEQKINSIWLN
jgi:type I restriction enzyme M protein